jgi:hypothetical protein
VVIVPKVGGIKHSWADDHIQQVIMIIKPSK